ncbi:MAG: peptide chain release factor N(5)-glutamine methyltransferase, partial [Bacteroidetes bacterium]|nr:peptide chain release factor N(5)-glutamine methyltransferase [Bacteroidota bacterium]
MRLDTGQQTTVEHLLNSFRDQLKNQYPIEEINAIFLRCADFYLKMDKLSLHNEPSAEVNAADSKMFNDVLDGLKHHEPIQYLLGETTFCNAVIKLSGSVLIPRQETEEFVQLIIGTNKKYNPDILDIGTGSGAIAIALKLGIPDSTIWGIDNSQKAIQIAINNAKINNVDVDFELADILLQQYDDLGNRFDIIVSNPPYVLNSEKVLMDSNVLNFEPHEALFVNDDDPLIYYEAIFNFAKLHLKKNGEVFLEINESKGQELKSYISAHHPFDKIDILKDLNIKDRFIHCSN